MIDKALHPRDDINWLYVSRKVGRGLTSIEDCMDALIQGLQDNIKKNKGLITAATNITDNIKTNNN